jgi:hypothetical protein
MALTSQKPRSLVVLLGVVLAATAALTVSCKKSDERPSAQLEQVRAAGLHIGTPASEVQGLVARIGEAARYEAGTHEIWIYVEGSLIEKVKCNVEQRQAQIEECTLYLRDDELDDATMERLVTWIESVDPRLRRRKVPVDKVTGTFSWYFGDTPGREYAFVTLSPRWKETPPKAMGGHISVGGYLVTGPHRKALSEKALQALLKGPPEK